MEIVTDSGLNAWGEAVLEGHAKAVLACVEEYREFCRENISAARLKGFMMAQWANCTEASNRTNLEGVGLFAKALGGV